jgi:RNA polymerase sigma-70 factor, ECF subfamily
VERFGAVETARFAVPSSGATLTRVGSGTVAPSASGASSCSLEELLEAAAQGDTGSFALLYDRVAPAVHGLARRVVRNDALAEEITHDALLDVWSRCTTFDRSRGTGRSWIMTIAHRRAVDVVRNEQSASERLARVGARSWERAYDVVTEEAFRRADAELLAHAMSRLTPLQHRAVTLAYYGGFTYREVAEILDVPVATAKTRIRDGLRGLQAALARL